MSIDLLHGKRQRDKVDCLEQIERDITGKKFLKKKAKLDDSNKQSKKIKSSIISSKNMSQSLNNLDNIDVGELVFKYNSVNTNVKCKICQKDITKNIKFYCNTCADFIFCINCFLLSKHPKSHDYHIIDNVQFPLYMEDWSANEEHKLLSTIAKCGLNNWEEICKSMDNKGQVECESHYYSFYNTNKDNPYPDENKIIINENRNIKEPQKELNKTLNEKMLLKCSSSKMNKIEASEEEIKKHKRNLRSLCIRKSKNGGVSESISDILGCKPKRKEFEHEFINDIEVELSPVEFSENNDEKEKDLKIKLDMFKDYNLILKEREKRKQFIFEKGLIDFRRQNRIESKLSKDEYDMLLFMKPFNRFYENSEFYDLFESIVIEQKLKLILKNIDKIENENDSKEKKITTIEDIEEHLETEKANNKGRKQVKSNNPHESKDNSNSIEDNLIADRIERYMQYNKLTKEKKEEELFDEDEFKFMKELPLARSTFYDIKLKIKEAVSLYENKGNHKNENLKKSFEKIIQKYDIERQTHLDIFEFYCKKYSRLINKKEARMRNKKNAKNGEINRSNNNTEEFNEESVSSNKRKKRNKKKEKNKGSKNKKRKNNIKNIEDESKSEKKSNNKENINNMDIDINTNMDIDMNTNMDMDIEQETHKEKEKEIQSPEENGDNDFDEKDISQNDINTLNNEIDKHNENENENINENEKEIESEIKEEKKEINIEETNIKYFEGDNL